MVGPRLWRTDLTILDKKQAMLLRLHSTVPVGRAHQVKGGSIVSISQVASLPGNVEVESCARASATVGDVTCPRIEAIAPVQVHSICLPSNSHSNDNTHLRNMAPKGEHNTLLYSTQAAAWTELRQQLGRSNHNVHRVRCDRHLCREMYMMSGLSYKMLSMPFPAQHTPDDSQAPATGRWLKQQPLSRGPWNDSTNANSAHHGHLNTWIACTVLAHSKGRHCRKSVRPTLSLIQHPEARPHHGARPSRGPGRDRRPPAGAPRARPPPRCCRSRSPWRARTPHGAPAAAPPQRRAPPPRWPPRAPPAAQTE